MGLEAGSGWVGLSSLSNQSREIWPPSAALMSSLQMREAHATQGETHNLGTQAYATIITNSPHFLY